jgi:hypothetical protein
MTLQALVTRFTAMLRELEGEAAAYDDPITPVSLIKDAVDTFARNTDAFWYAFEQNAVNAQAEYCAPPLYKLRSINYFDEQGNWHPLRGRSVSDLDKTGGYWRVYPASYWPWSVEVMGMNSIQLIPPPLVDNPIVSPLLQPLVEMEGFAIPSLCFKTDGTTPLFNALTDECPLNAVCHPGIAFEAMRTRIMQYPTKDNMARYPMIAQEAERYMGQLDAYALNYKPPYRYQEKMYRWGSGGW